MTEDFSMDGLVGKITINVDPERQKELEKVLTPKREFKLFKQLIEYNEKTFLVELGIDFEIMLSGSILPQLQVIMIREVDLNEEE